MIDVIWKYCARNSLITKFKGSLSNCIYVYIFKLSNINISIRFKKISIGRAIEKTVE